MSEMEEWMSENGARSVWTLADNEQAEAFYAACGFRPAGEAQTLFGPAPTMRRPLV